MLSRRLLLTASMAFGAIAATAVTPANAWDVVSFGRGPAVKGSGLVVDQARSVASFSRLKVEGPFDVQARPAASMSVSVRADDNLQSLISTTVEGETLVIKAQSGSSFSARKPILVNIAFTNLQSAELQGSGDLTITGLKTDRFELNLRGSGDARLAQLDLNQFTARVAGSGDITAQGRSARTAFDVAGSGDIRASELLSQRTSVSIAGSGDARVHASESLDVRIAGSGDVRYAGKPTQLTKQVSGSGEVAALR